MSIPVAPVEHVQLFKVKYSKKVAHRACLSVELNMHPNRQFPGVLVVHMPPCFASRVTCPLCSLRGARELSRCVCSPGGVRMLPRAGGYCSKGGGVLACWTLSV